MRRVLLGVRLKAWIKRREHPLANRLYRLAIGMRRQSIPVIPIIHGSLYALHRGVGRVASEIIRMTWNTPLFQARLLHPAPGLYLYNGMPHVMGPLEIEVGIDCQIAGRTSFIGRSSDEIVPKLVVGNKCAIGWDTSIMVGTRVILQDHVLIAGRTVLAGYPGHPLEPHDRAAGRPDLPEQIGDIVLEEAVWLATGVVVTAGVRIGRGTVVAAGSVVTKNLPPGVLAAGIPARIIRSLTPDTRHHSADTSASEWGAS
jgi:acetyltransferase-like isoleucine patch superfamily enzyme